MRRSKLSLRVTKSYKERIKRRILKAAFKEFSVKGYDKTNLDDVANSLGIARGTIYLYFPSKQRLFEAISEFQLKRLRKLLENHQWSSEEAASTARSFFKRLKVGLPENSEKMAIEMLGESSRNRELKRQRLLESRKMQQIITDFIQARMRNKRIGGSREWRELAVGMIALYDGLNMLKVLGYQEQEIEDAWTRTITLIVEGAIEWIFG